MKKGQKVAGLLMLVVLLLASCAPAAAPAPATEAPAPIAARQAPAPATAPATPAKETWQQEWELTLQAAKKEGRVVLYTTVGEYRRSMAAALQKYGITLESIIGNGGDMARKIFMERRAGIYSADIYTAGTSTILFVLKPGGALAPIEPVLILPEVKNPKMWWNDRLPWVDDGHHILATLTELKAPITINTNVVKPGEVKSYADLLNPKWKEKIIIQDPSTSGGGGKWFGVVMTVGILDENYMRKLAEQKPMITRDRRLQVDWLAHGKMTIAIAAQSAELNAFLQVGAPLASVAPAEGSYVSGTSGGLAMISNAAHPNAAKFFVNWVLSKEGQTVVSQTIGVQSARLDVPTDFLDPEALRKPGVKYIETENEKVLASVENYYKVAKEIFAIK